MPVKAIYASKFNNSLPTRKFGVFRLKICEKIGGCRGCYKRGGSTWKLATNHQYNVFLLLISRFFPSGNSQLLMLLLEKRTFYLRKARMRASCWLQWMVRLMYCCTVYFLLSWQLSCFHSDSHHHGYLDDLLLSHWLVVTLRWYL